MGERVMVLGVWVRADCVTVSYESVKRWSIWFNLFRVSGFQSNFKGREEDTVLRVSKQRANKEKKN
jgi:hypothetical protein